MKFIYQTTRQLNLIADSLTKDESASYYDPIRVIETDMSASIWLDLDTMRRDSDGELRLSEFQRLIQSISDFNQEKLSIFTSLLNLTCWEDAFCEIFNI